jgi:hypothetical protein
VTVLSLVLLAAAGVLLVVGILQGGTVLLLASIVTTVAAAGLLYLGVRRRDGAPEQATATAAPDASAAQRTEVPAAAKGSDGSTPVAHRPAKASGGRPSTAPGPAATEPAPIGSGDVPPVRTGDAPPVKAATSAGVGAGAGGPDGGSADRTAVRTAEAAGAAPAESVDDDPPDEPAIEGSTLGDLARIAALDDEVVVVDGRPRYHLRECGTLDGRESEGLPVSEAAELGFTPCAQCAPVAGLLARTSH